MKNKIFKYRVKDGAYRLMSGLLQYPQQVDPRMDTKICRITLLRSLKSDLRKQNQTEYKNDYLYQIEVKGIEDREFLILQSLLEDLEEIIIDPS